MNTQFITILIAYNHNRVNTSKQSQNGHFADDILQMHLLYRKRKNFDGNVIDNCSWAFTEQ